MQQNIGGSIESETSIDRT